MWREKTSLSQSGGAPGGWGVERRQNVGCPSYFVSHPRTNVSLPSENVRRPSQNVDPPSNYVRSPSNYVCLPIMFLGLLGCGVSGFWNGGVSSWDRGLRFSGCKCNAFREFRAQWGAPMDYLGNRRFSNPKGIASSSPGLRGPRYPGSRPDGFATPTGLRRMAPSGAQPRWGCGSLGLFPRVARASQQIGRAHV